MIETFTKDALLDQLGKILSSAQIANSKVLSEFLKYIVTETLEGKGDALKEYTIGTNALKRDADFNPQLDSVVRIHAGRLRRALKDYYTEAGVDDTIIISIPKGSYVPAFSGRAYEPVPLAKEIPEKVLELMVAKPEVSRVPVTNLEPRPRHNKPTIAILPFRDVDREQGLKHFGHALSEYLNTELTMFDDFRIISYFTGRHLQKSHDIREVANYLSADYVMTGTVLHAPDAMRIYVQLNDGDDGNQLWAHTFEKTSPEENNWSFQERIVDYIIANITGVYGTIWRNEMEKFSGAAHDTTQLHHYYLQYANNFNEASIRQVKQYFQTVLEKSPHNVQAMAYLSEVMAGEAILLRRANTKLEKAVDYAQQALRLDSRCQQAYKAHAINMIIQRNRKECVRRLEQGLAINPRAAEYKASMGALLVLAGDLDRGIEMLDKAIALSTPVTWWENISYALYAYVKKFYTDALFWADRVELDVVWIPLIKAAAYAQLDQPKEALPYVHRLKSSYPDVDLANRKTLSRLFYSDDLLHSIEEGLKKLPVQ